MQLAANFVIVLIAILHVYIMLLEIFLWDKPAGLRAFGHTAEAARATLVLAKNQGLYNGFLAAGLGWGLGLGSAGNGIKLFFSGCVFTAGIFGALTANRKALWIQALPASIGLALLLAAGAH